MNTNDKMMELKDVVVTIKGEEINLGDLTYHDFAEMMDTLSDDEAKALLDTVVATIGEENFIKFIGKLQMLADMEDEEEAEDEKEDVKGKQQPVILDPVRLVNMADVFSYDLERIVGGIDSVSDKVGQYIAYVNAGLTNAQAYELITIDGQREHELKMAEKQLELEKIKVEAQVRAKGVSQLLNR